MLLAIRKSFSKKALVQNCIAPGSGVQVSGIVFSEGWVQEDILEQKEKEGVQEEGGETDGYDLEDCIAGWQWQLVYQF